MLNGKAGFFCRDLCYFVIVLAALVFFSAVWYTTGNRKSRLSRNKEGDINLMLNRAQLKQEAKGIVRSARVSAYLMTLIFLAITYVLNGIDIYVGNDVGKYLAEFFPELDLPSAMTASRFSVPVVVFTGVMVWLLNIVLSGGWTLYHLGIRRGYEMGYGTLFDGFAIVGKLILATLAVTAIVTLGTVLLLFPGLIFAYMYRFTIYNICENPSLGVIQAMRMSRLQTYRHKMDLFVLDLSFIGWGILISLTMGILSIWIRPYMEQTNIGYFIALKRASGVGVFPDTGSEGPDAGPVF